MATNEPEAEGEQQPWRSATLEDPPTDPEGRFELVQELMEQRIILCAPKGHPQRAAFYYPGLRESPYWDPAEFPWATAFREGWTTIRDELHRFQERAEARQFSIVFPGNTDGEWAALWVALYRDPEPGMAEAFPETLKLIDAIPRRAQWAGYSALAPGSRITPHYGPTNVKLRCHLGIELEEGKSHLRVHDQPYDWKEGELVIFDDSYKHEASNEGTRRRIVFIIDVMHPDLTDEECAFLTDYEDTYIKPQSVATHRKWQAESPDTRWASARLGK